MQSLTFTLHPDLVRRLETLSTKMNRSTNDCLQLAVEEFLDNWELHLNDLYQMTDDEARAVLNAPQD